MPGCIFCDTPPTTRTHIFRKAWLEQIMPSDEGFAVRHQREGPGAFDSWWSTREFDLSPRSTCATCNGGWMNDIDMAAEPLVEPCIAGRATTLDSDEIDSLARWVTLVSFLYDQVSAEPAVTNAQHHAFYATRNPPEGAIIWLAASLAPERGYELNAWLRPVSLDSAHFRGNGYFCTFRIQHLVVQAFIPTPAPIEKIALNRGDPGFVLQIWPTPEVTVAWPPIKALQPRDLQKFAEAFITDRGT